MPAKPVPARPENACPTCGNPHVVRSSVHRMRCKKCGRTFNEAAFQEVRAPRPSLRGPASLPLPGPSIVSAEPKRHIYVPDTQVRKGVPVDHLDWIAEYIAAKGCDRVVIGGDWWDMPALSMHDPLGSARMEGARIEDDISSGNDALERFTKRIVAKGSKAAKAARDVTMGNHEYRIDRAVSMDPRYAGVIGMHHLNAERLGWTAHPFRQIVDLDGIWYSHYFYNPLTGRPWGGTIDNRLNKIGHSFVQGHEQAFRYATRHLSNGIEQHGLVAGACYLHDEDYKGPQGNYHFRGIVVMNEVRGGSYDLMRVSLDFLCRKFEGMPLGAFLRKKYPDEPLTLKALP